jgi:hypothetical protein
MHPNLPRVALLLPCLLLLCFAAPARAEDEPVATLPEIGLWSDTAHLDKELAVALDAVARAEGKAFKKKPGVQVSTAAAMATLLEAELGQTLRRLGTADDAVKRTLFMYAHGLVMKYEPERDVIHVVPANVARIVELLKKPELASADMLRITLIHEAAHAHDFQHHPSLDEARRMRETAEGLQAVNAVIEGHAQFIASKAARALGLEQAFERLVELTVAVPPTDDPVTRVLSDVLVAEQRFAYSGGHRFFEAVFAERGEAGVESVLLDPPQSVRLIEQPDVYLDPASAGTSVDATAVLAPVQAWSDGAGRTATPFPFKRAQLDGVFAMLPATDTAAMRGAFTQGWGLVSHRTGPDDMVVVILSEFRKAESAADYVRLAGVLMRKKDETMTTGPVRILGAEYEDGAGPDHEFPGLVATKKMSVNGTETGVVAHNVHLGRYVLDVTFIDQRVDRETQDALVGRLGAALRAQLDGAAARPSDTAVLRALVASFHAAQKARDEETLAELGRALCPTSAELQTLCREGEAATAFLAAYSGPRQERLVDRPDGDKEIGRHAFVPGNPAQTEVQVHQATTEELAAYAEGTLAFQEFPGGMRRFAEQVAAPGRTWFVVELLEPGKGVGMKYSCFTKVGERFVVVLKPWAAVPR